VGEGEGEGVRASPSDFSRPFARCPSAQGRSDNDAEGGRRGGGEGEGEGLFLSARASYLAEIMSFPDERVLLKANGSFIKRAGYARSACAFLGTSASFCCVLIGRIARRREP